ncbi:MAG: hypothetical protein IJ383_05155 [Bacteroidales bacterium]|nr:hypothetical protein [Bacteroidales bacterium]
MKKIFIIALAAGLAANMAMAQPQRPSKEEMQKNKCERIVKELALDNRTAQEFTDIYTKYQAEVNAINEKYPQPKMQLPDNRRPDRQGPDKKSRGKVKDAQAPAPQEKAIPTDAEIEKRIKDGFAREKALLNAKERYYNEFRKVLTPQQIQKMYTMENAPRHRGQMGGRPGGFQGTPGGFQGGHGQMGGMNPPDFF